MTKKGIILIVSILCNVVLFAQNGKLYFIKGQQFMSKIDVEFENHPSVELFSIQKDSLIVVDTIIKSNEEFIRNIRIYNDRGILTIVSNSLRSDTIQFVVINFLKNCQIKQYTYFNKEYYSNENWLINIKSKDYIVTKQSSDKNSRLLGLDIETGNVCNFKDSVLNYFVGDGIQGVGIDNVLSGQNEKEELKLKSFLVNNSIHYKIKNLTEMNVDYEFIMPHQKDLEKIDPSFLKASSKRGYIPINIRNSNMLVIKRAGYYDDAKKRGGRRYVIYNKNLGKWILTDFEGSYRSLHAFNNWLVGSIIDEGNLGNTQKREKGIDRNLEFN